MRYGIGRHENALGNSAEHTVGLAKHIKRIGDTDPKIFVENEFQKYFALCIPGIEENDVAFFDDLKLTDYNEKTWKGFDSVVFDDILMPNAYPFSQTYLSVWANLNDLPDETLIFPDNIYQNNHNLPKNAIVISIREIGTYGKRVDGSSEDLGRFVNPNTFFDIALHYANLGHIVVRIGDKNQTPMPNHSNIIDFALMDNRSMLDDLFLINHSKVFLSCDSGIGPMAGGMKKNLILSNFTSGIKKTAIKDWLPAKTTIVLPKENGKDNSFEQLKTAIDKFL